MLRNELQFWIARGDEHPAIEMVAARKSQKKFDGTVVRGACPSETAIDVARICRDWMIVGYEPDRNSAPSEAPSKPKTPMCAADNQRPDGHVLPIRTIG